MAKTPLVQTPVTLGGRDGVNPFATSETPDIVNGNSFVHTLKRGLLIRNTHDDKYVSCQPVVQRSITEKGEALTISNPTATQVPAGGTMIMGPFTAGNFRKAADGRVEFNWALEGGGDIAAADVDVAVIDFP